MQQTCLHALTGFTLPTAASVSAAFVGVLASTGFGVGARVRLEHIVCARGFAVGACGRLWRAWTTVATRVRAIVPCLAVCPALTLASA